MSSDKFFTYAVFFEGGLGVVALFFGFLFGLDLFGGVVFSFSDFFLILVLTLFLLIFYFILRVIPFECFREIDRLICKIFRQYMVNISILGLAIISFVAGFGEELFFRGLLQNGLCEAAGGGDGNIIIFGKEFWSSYRILAILIFVSVLFGVAHAVTATYFFLAFFISIYLGVILIVTENIIIPIAIHALYDFFILVYLKKRLE
ncbi:MAG: CPBP family intramembrane metalloprotease [Planctomycetaceae bacterium]|jgi:membrane protease YdiL (CAAX protease family)|nr:CPBP family intramembrane metalloprotease [Planctomycetaceae bacterium]